MWDMSASFHDNNLCTDMMCQPARIGKRYDLIRVAVHDENGWSKRHGFDVM